MRGKCTTGLSGLDAQLGGGVPEGSCVLLMGYPMNAQELLAYQFGSAVPKALLVSTNRPKDEVESAMEGIGLTGTGVDVRFAGNRLVKPTKDVRFILDNISDVKDRIGWDDTLAYLDEVRETVRKGGETALIIAYTGLHTEPEMTRLQMWADGVMELGFDRQGFGLYPFLKVTKMRGSPDSSRFLLFKETPKGLFMESTRRVF